MNTQNTNPLLDTLKARLPGETFKLPSGGLFYNNGELSADVTNGEVHVFPLTAVDEILLKTPDKLLSGRAIAEVFARCIPQITKPDQLLSRDVDYLLMCLRLISYGDTVSITYNHHCKETSVDRSYEVSLRPLVQKARQIDPTTLTQLFVITLPSEQVVHLRPPLFGSVMRLYLTNFEASNSDEDIISTQLKLLDIVTDTIVSVDGIDDRNMIREWIKALPAGWMQQISDALQHVSEWGPSTSVQVTCKDCGEAIEIEIPLNPIAFFS